MYCKLSFKGKIGYDVQKYLVYTLLRSFYSNAYDA